MELKAPSPSLTNNSEKNAEKYKFLEKSDQFHFEVLSKNEILNFIVSFALIEEKSLNQKIIVSVKPYVNKKILLDKENKETYIEEIKKALSRVAYREKFSLDDFRDISDFYNKDNKLTLKKILDDIVSSIKEKKARIKINKYHMIFNYFINNDITDVNNSVMLCLDNEIESSILEKYYENTFRKIFKEKANENLDESKKMEISEQPKEKPKERKEIFKMITMSFDKRDKLEENILNKSLSLLKFDEKEKKRKSLKNVSIKRKKNKSKELKNNPKEEK